MYTHIRGRKRKHNTSLIKSLVYLGTLSTVCSLHPSAPFKKITLRIKKKNDNYLKKNDTMNKRIENLTIVKKNTNV